jgi:hypothetical protein
MRSIASQSVFAKGYATRTLLTRKELIEQIDIDLAELRPQLDGHGCHLRGHPTMITVLL